VVVVVATSILTLETTLVPEVVDQVAVTETPTAARALIILVVVAQAALVAQAQVALVAVVVQVLLLSDIKENK
jgi:hypothetical protein